jgi:hypothetical protein
LGYPTVSLSFLFSHAFAPLFLCSHLVPHLINLSDGQHKESTHQRQQREQPATPPTLEQVLLMQAQMLQTMQQMMANMHQGQGHQQTLQPHPRDKFGEF